MNILILGSGGREHALAWKITQSPLCNNLFVAPGNSGTAAIANNLDISVNDFPSIKTAALKHQIQMLVVGPEDPLVNGVHDVFLKDPELQHIAVIGPQQAAAQLEGSKEFAKEFLYRHNIPTAAYQSFTANELEQGYEFLNTLSPPYVLKADGLAAGKGVLILDNLDQAKTELKQMLVDSKFGTASSKVVIEEFLDGIELSCFVLTDGVHYKILPTAKDYKRIGEGDTGLNTGGMGAISPVPFADDVLMQNIEDRIVKPTVEGLKKDRLPYKGFIFIGLIVVNNEPLVIEYNVRMGDPETEAVIPRINTDLVELFMAVKNQTLNQIQLQINPQAATTVMLVSGGYPEAYEKGKEIHGIMDVKEALVFHAGAQQRNKKIVTSGGRVMAITAFGQDYKSALKTAYGEVSKINFEGMNFRTDLGFDL
jgi:phosphoribosylamine--glycine ligase